MNFFVVFLFVYFFQRFFINLFFVIHMVILPCFWSLSSYANHSSRWFRITRPMMMMILLTWEGREWLPTNGLERRYWHFAWPLLHANFTYPVVSWQIHSWCMYKQRQFVASFCFFSCWHILVCFQLINHIFSSPWQFLTMEMASLILHLLTPMAFFAIAFLLHIILSSLW